MKPERILNGTLGADGSRCTRAAAVICLLLPLSCVLLPLPAIAQRPTEHNHRHLYQKEVEALEMEWRDAMLHHDAATIDGLLADDYVGINSSGMLQTKEDTLARLRSGAVIFKQMDLSEVKVSVHGETAVVTCRAAVESSQNGIERDGIYRYTRVYQHRGGVWKVVNFEATRINPLANSAAVDSEVGEESSAQKAPAGQDASGRTQAH